ncbi:hypothetical protein CBR_g42069 [Chara braunii]|uniref:Ubiquitin-like protease family profile domain-containing protein n=1 Tax=Chara braunii TaxID=69332 RepID=A0A388LWZ2_CHABU|nr:hypothetical protein CBR_g42069 [Chara braunii]|eukprot:GBG86785.1 hypothetical protein CBR_g42069 [Chara braunii]
MLCVEAHKDLQADCRTEGELATSSNVEPNTLGAELAVVSDSPVKAVMSASLETAGARMNPNQGPVNISLPDASLETTVIRIYLRHTDEGLQLAGVEGCRLLTTLDKDNSADDQFDPILTDVGMELPVQPGYDDPLYSALHNEAMGDDVLKKVSDAVGGRFLYLSDDDKDTAYGYKKLRGGEVLLDIHGTLSPTQYDTVAMEKTQPVDVVDVDDLCPEMNIPSTVIDADISSLSSFPVGLEHVVAASTRAGVPIVLGLSSVGSGEVVARPGFPRDGRAVLEDIICSRLPLTIIVVRLPSHSLQVSVKDIVTLVDRSGELNDEVVNFYMAMLLDDCGRTAATMKTYTFNSFFASSLLLRGLAAILRWAKDVDLLSHDLVLAPVHKDGEHWSLFAIDFSRRVLEIYDSFSCSSSKDFFYSALLDKTVKFFSTVAGAAGDGRTFDHFAREVSVKGVPRQHDGASCGVFMLMFASCLARGLRPPFGFSHRHISSIRARLALAICDVGRDFIELSLCLAEVRVAWTRDESNYPRSERLELLLIQAWRTEVEGDLLGFLFGAVRPSCRRLLTQELTVPIAQLADHLDVSIVSQVDPRLVPHVTLRTLLPYLQWSAWMEGLPSRIPPSRLDYLDPRDIVDPAFYRTSYEDELEEIILEELVEESSEEEEENLNEDEGESAQQQEGDEDELLQTESEEEAEEEDSEQGSGDDNDEEQADEDPQLEIALVADLPISNDPTLDPEPPQPDDGHVAHVAGPSARRPPSPPRRR